MASSEQHRTADSNDTVDKKSSNSIDLNDKSLQKINNEKSSEKFSESKMNAIESDKLPHGTNVTSNGIAVTASTNVRNDVNENSQIQTKCTTESSKMNSNGKGELISSGNQLSTTENQKSHQQHNSSSNESEYQSNVQQILCSQ